MRISDWSSDVCSSDLDARDIPLYVAAQVLGAIVAAWLLYYIAQGSPAFDIANGLAANGYDAGSPGGYDIWSALIIEIVLTAGFVWVIMGSTDGRAPAGFAPLAIGLALTLLHLISIPVTNTSVNPARSTGPALVVGGLALQQRSEEHTSELQSLMRNSYAVFCLKKKKKTE